MAARKLDNGEIGKTIATLRRSRGMTQQNLADKVYEGMTTISRIEKGHRPNLSVDLLQRIAEALDVTMNDLCYATTESPSPAQEEHDPIIYEATALISALSPEDRTAALRMLRGLSQHI